MIHKDFKDMSNSDKDNYIRTLQLEINSLNVQIYNQTKADTFTVNSVSNPKKLGQLSFASEREVLDSMEIGDVIQASRYISLGDKFLVKITANRIDSYDSAIEAEGVAMLHNLNE